jgi:WD40 repeat protein
MRCWPLCLLAVALSPGVAPAQPPRADAAGDPLPSGAVARLGSVRFHQAGGLVAAEFAPDGKSLVVVGNSDKNGLAVCFWDTATGKERSAFIATPYATRGVGFLPDGDTVVLHGHQAVTLHDRATGKELRSFEVTSGTSAVSPDGTLLASQAGDVFPAVPIRLFDVATGKPLDPLPGRGGGFGAMRFSSDGKRLAVWSIVPTGNGKGFVIDQQSARLVCVYDVATRKLLHELDVGFGQVALAPDGLTAAVVQNGCVRVLDVATGKAVCKIAAEPLFLAFTPDGKGLVTSAYLAAPVLWDAATGQQIRSFDAPCGERTWLAGFSPDGKTLALITGQWNEDGSVLLLDVASGKPLRQGAGHANSVTCAAFAPGGKLLASGSADRTVRLWDVATAKELKCLDGHAAPVSAVAFGPGGKLLASSSADGKTLVWDAAGKQVARLDGPEGGALALAFSADGKTLTAGGKEGTVEVWSVPAGKLLRSHKVGPDGYVLALGPGAAFALSANGELREESVSERLRVWSLSTMKSLAELPLRPAKREFDTLHVWTAAISGEGKLLAAAHSRMSLTKRGTMYADHEVCVWEKATGEEVCRIKGYRAHALAFGPGGRLLALGHGNNYGAKNTVPDHDVSVWDVLSGERKALCVGHANQIGCVAFSPDGRLLVSGSADHTLLVWEVPPIGKAAAEPPPGE